MYPKTYYEENPLLTKPGTCFLIMPFKEQFNPVLATMMEVLEGPEIQMTCTRTDNLFGSSHVMLDILSGIRESEIVLADLTEQNANVFYELGIAHMIKENRKVILISQDHKWVPFDLRPFRYLVYENSDLGLSKLRTSLTEAIKAAADGVYRFTVNGAGPGGLGEKILGKDDYFYEFNIKKCEAHRTGAKFWLHVLRHAIKGKTISVYDDAWGLRVGEICKIPSTQWAVRLVHSEAGRAIFGIEEKSNEKFPRASVKNGFKRTSKRKSKRPSKKIPKRAPKRAAASKRRRR
jgi:hypothetical protein